MQVGLGKKSYYNRWMLPEKGLNSGINFEGRPVKNYPEHILWDFSLNKDKGNCFHYQVVLTEILPSN